MLNLKLKCTLCGKEESNPEIIKEASAIIEKYGLKSEHFLSLINLMSGKCMDSDEHSFVFDEAFSKNIEEIVTKLKLNLEESEKLTNEQRELLKQIREFEIKIKESKSKNDERLQNIYENSNDLRKELLESTGNNLIEIWI